MPGPDRVNVVSPSGEPSSIPTSALGAALLKDYTLETPEQEVDRASEAGKRQNLEGTLGGFKAGAQALARGLSFGTSDIVQAWGNPQQAEELRLLKEVHPTISTGVELGAQVLPTFFSGGAGAAGSLSRATLPGAFSALGNRIAGTAVRDVAGLAAKEIGTEVAEGAVKKIARATAGAAFEGLAQSTGSYFSEVALGNKKLSAEGYLASVGLGVGIAGGLGATFAAGEKALSAVAKLFPKRQLTEAAVKKAAGNVDTQLKAALEAGASARQGSVDELNAMLANDVELQAQAAVKVAARKQATEEAKLALVNAKLEGATLKNQMGAQKLATQGELDAIRIAKAKAPPLRRGRPPKGGGLADVEAALPANDSAIASDVGATVDGAAPAATPDAASAPTSELGAMLGQGANAVPTAPVADVADELATPSLLEPIHEAMAELSPAAKKLVDSVKANEAAEVKMRRFTIRDSDGTRKVTIPEMADLTVGRAKDVYGKATAGEKAQLLETIGPQKAKALTDITQSEENFAKWYGGAKGEEKAAIDNLVGPLKKNAPRTPRDVQWRLTDWYKGADDEARQALLSKMSPERAAELVQLDKDSKRFVDWFKNKNHWDQDLSYTAARERIGPSPEDLHGLDASVMPGFEGATPSGDDLARLTDERLASREASLASAAEDTSADIPLTFAERVREAAAQAPAGSKYGKDKVFISDLWQQMEGKSGISLDDFKAQLVKATEDGQLSLSRADLVGAMDPGQVAKSRVMRDGAELNFVNADFAPHVERPIAPGAPQPKHISMAGKTTAEYKAAKAAEKVRYKEALAEFEHHQRIDTVGDLDLKGHSPADLAEMEELHGAISDISDYERTMADMVTALGPKAPPQAARMAADYTAALDDQMRKSTERAAQALDDLPPPPLASTAPEALPLSVGEAPPVSTAGIPAPEAGIGGAAADAVPPPAAAAAEAASAKPNLAEALGAKPPVGDARKAADLISLPGAPALEKGARRGGLLGMAADVGAGLEALQMVGVNVPFMPDVDKIPVVGPVLGAYLKLRALSKGMRKFGIKLPFSGEAKIAAGSARTQDRISNAMTGILSMGARAASGAHVLAAPSWRAADVLKASLYDDGDKRRSKSNDVHEMMRARADELQAAQANPAALQTSVRASLKDVRDPDVIAAVTDVAVRIHDYLAKNVPAGPPPSVLGRNKWQSSPSQIESFARRVRATKDPVSVLEDVRDGRVTPEAVDALRVCYPELYDEARTCLLEGAKTANKDLPAAVAVRLAVTFDAPLISSLEPQNLRAIQNAGKPKALPPGAPPPGAMQPPPAGAPQLSQLYKTAAQRRE